MPTDSAIATVEVAAPLDGVLATLRDVERQVEWIPQIQEAELLEVYEDSGLPATARFKASATVGTDEYTLSYDHSDTTMSWTMVKGRLQTGQEGCWTLEDVGAGRTAVTYELTIHHNLPLPGFIRRRVIKGLVDDTLQGLAEHLAASYS
ncbi:SRPBCC family protein [Nocardioides panaciterrulae]|uniref:Carbon monoxide dehydrogenase subunit G n=1 Tax=Nocardioides panaciterrulae TaxID=661492 RepID=A0A7Y9E8M3_9ACTN|nr:SRPBCC family protein [Nocardioides panaciterrulae]NYD42886.1 carbon monoxide dehydrogenase subunit G [Nocardioides panaciterrulae]